jgi:uncharacterized glyoxalase superfamily protein PhnB
MSGTRTTVGLGESWKVGTLARSTGVTVRDCDEHYARTVAAGAEIAEEPVDRDYGIREYGARDPEGQVWYFQSPIAELGTGEYAPGFTRFVRTARH